MVRVPSHPRLEGKPGYVFEHILVMESVLGRHLLRKESVHHKNGLKWDNVPDNLELWVKAHPSGARVSDLVCWAEKILREYAPKLLRG